MSDSWRRSKPNPFRVPVDRPEEPEQIGEVPAWFSKWLSSSTQRRRTTGLIRNRNDTFLIDPEEETIRMGAASAIDTGIGVWIAPDGSGGHEFRVGDPANDYIQWDGSALEIVGQLTATSGEIGGWTISSDELSSGNVSIQSDAERILMGSATAPLTGIGIFLGLDGSDYEARFGDPAGDYVHFDGTTLEINTETFTGTNPVFTGTVSVEGGEGETRAVLGINGGGHGQVALYDSGGDLSGTLVGAANLELVAEQNLTLSATPSDGDINVQTDGGGDVNLTTSGSGSQVQITAETLRINVSTPALGGGSTATLGAVGGSGPATATQAQWLEVSLDGTLHYIPVWT